MPTARPTTRSDDDARKIVPGTLDTMILAVVADSPAHGYAIAAAIKARSGPDGAGLIVEEGTLYPALRRLERDGLLRGDWKQSETKRRARFYELTEAGQTHLAREIERWRARAAAVDRVLGLVRPTYGTGVAS